MLALSRRYPLTVARAWTPPPEKSRILPLCSRLRRFCRRSFRPSARLCRWVVSRRSPPAGSPWLPTPFDPLACALVPSVCASAPRSSPSVSYHLRCRPRPGDRGSIGTRHVSGTMAAPAASLSTWRRQHGDPAATVRLPDAANAGFSPCLRPPALMTRPAMDSQLRLFRPPLAAAVIFAIPPALYKCWCVYPVRRTRSEDAAAVGTSSCIVSATRDPSAATRRSFVGLSTAEGCLYVRVAAAAPSAAALQRWVLVVQETHSRRRAAGGDTALELAAVLPGCELAPSFRRARRRRSAAPGDGSAFLGREAYPIRSS